MVADKDTLGENNEDSQLISLRNILTLAAYIRHSQIEHLFCILNATRGNGHTFKKSFLIPLAEKDIQYALVLIPLFKIQVMFHWIFRTPFKTLIFF